MNEEKSDSIFEIKANDLQRLSDALELAYARPWVLAWRSFVNGFMGAVGAWVGAVAVLTISGLLVQHFHLLTPVIDKLEGAAISAGNKVVQQVGVSPTPTP